MDTHFATADAYSHNLAKAGVAAHEVVVDAATSAAGLGARARRRPRRRRPGARAGPLVRARRRLPAEPERPRRRDARGDPRRREAARRPDRERSSWRGAPPLFDLLLTSFPHYVERFRALGVGSEYFRIGFDPRILDDLDEASPTGELVFVGALNRLHHRRGNSTFNRAARQVPIEFWGYDLRGWPPWSRIRRGYRGQAWGLEMYRLLATRASR